VETGSREENASRTQSAGCHFLLMMELRWLYWELSVSQLQFGSFHETSFK
jgi:hypothetical protein